MCKYPPSRVVKQTKEKCSCGLQDRSGPCGGWLVEDELGEGSPKSAEKTPGIK